MYKRQLPLQQKEDLVLDKNDEDDDGATETGGASEGLATQELLTEEHKPQIVLVPYSQLKQERVFPVAEHTPTQSSWASRLFQTSPNSVMENEELRIASDGYTYTKQEFFDYYGSFMQWERAHRIIPQQHITLSKIEHDDASEKAESDASDAESDNDEDIFSDYGEEEIDDAALARMMTRVM